MATWMNAEDLEDGMGCPKEGCGGYLHKSPFSRGLVCSTCEEVFRGR